MDEFEERIGAAFSATVVGDLAALTADLPEPDEPVEPSRTSRPPP